MTSNQIFDVGLGVFGLLALGGGVKLVRWGSGTGTRGGGTQFVSMGGTLVSLLGGALVIFGLVALGMLALFLSHGG